MLRKHVNIPNILSFSRIVASPPLFWAVMENNNSIAIGLLTWCAVSDYLDGKIARKYPKTQQSSIGPMIDPIGDKLCIASVTGALLIKGSIPVYLGSIIVGRDFLLLSGSVISSFILKSKEKIRVTFLSKINTTLQMILLGIILWEDRKMMQDENNSDGEKTGTKIEKKALLMGIVAGSTTLSALEYLLIFLKKMR